MPVDPASEVATEGVESGSADVDDGLVLVKGLVVILDDEDVEGSALAVVLCTKRLELDELLEDIAVLTLDVVAAGLVTLDKMLVVAAVDVVLWTAVVDVHGVYNPSLYVVEEVAIVATAPVDEPVHSYACALGTLYSSRI